MGILKTITGQGWLAAGSATLFFVAALTAPETIAMRDESLLLSIGLASTALLWFLAVLRAHLRRSEGVEGTFSALAMASGLLVVAFFALGGALRVVPGMGITEAAVAAPEASSIQFAEAANNVLLHIATFWRGSLLAAVAIVVLRHGGLPRWFGWLSAVLAVGSAIGAISFVESPIASSLVLAGYGSYIAFHFWVLVGGIVLAVRSRTETSADPRRTGVHAISERGLGV
jgi:hypothetical protein